MKKSIKLLAPILALAMLFALTACNAKTSPDVAASVEPEIAEIPQATENETGEQGSATISYPISEETITLTGWRAFAVDIPAYHTTYDNPTMTALDEATGVHVDFTEVSGMEGMSMFNIMAASGNYADIMIGAADFYSGGEAKAVEDGVIMDLSDLIKKSAPDYLAAVEKYDLYRDITNDGRYLTMYGIYDALSEGLGYIIRQDWLDELDLDTPVTYDDYYEVLSTFKTSYDLPNAFLMCETAQDSEHLANGYGTPGFCFSPFNAISYLYVEEGQVKNSFTETGYKKYLLEMNRWYEAGLFNTDFVSVSSRPNDDGRIAAITSEETGVFYLSAANLDELAVSIGGNAKLAGIADPLETPGELTHFSDGTHVAAGVNLCLSDTCSDPEAALKWVNYTFTDDGYRLFSYGAEGTMYYLNESGEPELDIEFLSNNSWNVGAITAYKGYALTEICIGLFDRAATNAFYSDAALQAVNTWTNMSDGEYFLPNAVSLTTAEDEEFNAKNSDISTYANESTARFILGELNFEADWDSFVATMQSLGIDRVVEIYQVAYERYIG